MKNLVLHLCFICFWGLLSAQDTIFIENSHFEMKEMRTPEDGWQTTGLRPPLVIYSALDNLDVKPFDGNRCVALTVAGRDWAGITQILKDTLKKDSLYRFSVWLSHSDKLKSNITVSGNSVSFKAAACLGIMGYRRAEGVAEVLAITSPVQLTAWQKYVIYFRPSQSGLNELTLFAAAENGFSSDPGNILIDRISKIVKIPAPYPDSLSDVAGMPLKGEKIDASGIPVPNPSFEYVWWGGRPQYWQTLYFDKTEGGKPLTSEELIAWDEQRRSCIPMELEPGFIKKAADGRRFTTLFTSECGLQAALCATLPYVQMQKDSVYTWSVSLAKEKRWKGIDDNGPKYKNPLRLRIWAGTRETPRTELLAVSAPIGHSDWRTYKFQWQPRKDSSSILLLEACFLSPYGQPYSGHLLLDNCSPIQQVRIR